MAKWKEPKPLKSDPKKAQEWQQRSQQRAIQKLRERGAKLAPQEDGRSGAALKPGTLQAALSERRSSIKRSKPGSAKPYRPASDGPWRAQCIMARGEYCRCCGKTEIQMDHIKPKGQGGKNDVENGLPLCAEHHRMKTDSEILIEWAWLDKDQLEYLANIGWVDWDDEGEPFGRGMKHFARRSRAGMKGGH